MRIGIANKESWHFLHEVYDELQAHHTVSKFAPRKVNFPLLSYRINYKLLKHDLLTLMKRNDVVLFEWASGLLAAASKMPKKSFIVTRLHRYEMYYWPNRINWDNIDIIILDSLTKQREFVERVPEHSHKTMVIHVGVNPDKFAFVPKPFKGDIGILCNLIPRKRVYELVLAFSELLKQKNDFHLHIGGGREIKYDDYYYSLINLIDTLGLKENITIYPPVKDVKAWYQKIDIFISNSYSEGLQISPLEAMASGRFVLSHRWAGAEEMLPEEYLYYTNRELQQKIMEYCNLTTEGKISRLNFLRERVMEKFNVHKTKVDIRRVFEELVNGKHA